MTPIRLQMKNFITYVNEEIDFVNRHLTNEVFLINGKTGAGKTTIFDAIMFALYGETSGSARGGGSREGKYRALHSSYAEPTAKTEVIFEFKINGKNYKAYREFHFSKTGNLQPPMAELTGDGIAAVTGPEKVTAKCSELLGGLSAEQFKQVSMLPQGEFRKFMEADSAKRQEILQMLFSMEGCTRYVKLINGAYDRIQNRRKGAQDRITYSMSGFAMPEWVESELRDRLTAYNTELVPALQEVTNREREQLRAAKEAHEQAGTARSAAEKQRTEAGSGNKLVEASQKAADRLAELQGKKAAMDQLEAETQKADRTIGIVRAPMDRCDIAAKALRDETVRHEDAVRNAGAHTEVLRKAEEDLRIAAANEDEIRVLTEAAAKISEELPRYCERSGHVSNVRNTGMAMNRAAEEIEKIKAAQAANEETIARLNAALEKLTDADTRLANAKHALDTAKQRRDSWKQVQKKLADAELAGKRLTAQKESELTLSNDHIAKKEKADRIETEFLKGQARQLAIELGRENELADAPCKVCGHVWSKGTFVFGAEAGMYVPTEDEVKAAKAACEEAQKKANAANAKTGKLDAEYTAACNACVEAANALLEDRVTWAELTAEGFMDARSEVFADDVRRCEDTKKTAERDASERSEAEKQRAKASAEQPALAKKLEEQQKSHAEYSESHAASKQALETIKVSYTTEAEAKNELDRLTSKREALEKQLKQARKTRDDENARQTALDTAAKESADRLAKLTKEDGAAKEELRKALIEAGFTDDLKAAKAAMHPEDAAFVRKNTAVISGYRSDLANAIDNAAKAAEAAKGLEIRDLAALDLAVRAAMEAEKQANERVKRMNTGLEMHEKILSEVTGARTELDRTQSAFDRIKELKEMANRGISFERFALSGDFDEVLDRANDRLARLSDGRFVLSRTDKSERRTAAAGLGIEIKDCLADRVERCNDISGGEGFLVSMSLALGLSDVAQSRAGGTTVDTIFIDEGFGTLDAEKLHDAVEVLNMLSYGRRTVGIISHVKELEEVIATRVTVEYQPKKGSSIQFI